MTDPHHADHGDTEDTADLEDPGTQPASLDDLDMESVATMRPMSTQAVFRPDFDDDDDDLLVHTGDTEPQEHTTTLTRNLAPTRRLGGGGC